MRRTIPLLLITLALASSAVPAAAETAALLHRDREGNLRMIRLADLSHLTDTCGAETPDQPVPAIPMRLVAGDQQQLVVFHVAETQPMLWFRAGRGPLIEHEAWCPAAPEVLTALEQDLRLPSNRGPWLGFITAFGGLAVLIGIFGLWGLGVGPMPSLAREGEPPKEDHH